ncbi:hypothetical protein DAPPUDRAFT_249570 [Daphnia pulex]|uniref:Tubulin-folding cofactor D C-terminal domain-containing protein n=1 Tax=Daphnia pulex TaxID=6669 RepID=E9GWY2_DAPPU|nr:hypothetical protein DAPPUDRAFT_249570 [Daphnia pulex]|eukprot:EFX76035.1 hypothetical protein DAPPUDRAFT_249570 [Daphnia pulex]
MKTIKPQPIITAKSLIHSTALRECLASADSNVQQSAISAVTALIGDYFRHQPVEKLTALLNHFLPEVTSNNQQARVGNAPALGSMPRDPPHRFFAESHPTVVGGVDQVTLAGIFRTFIDGFEDYTVDSRGDIGAIVRKSAMYSIQVLTNTSQPDLLEADLIRSVLHAVTKQSWMKVMRLDTYRKAVITGLVSSIGSLTESLTSY